MAKKKDKFEEFKRKRPADLTYETYRKAIYIQSRDILLKTLTGQEVNTKVFKNIYFNLKGPKTFRGNYSPKEKHLAILLNGFLEIQLCLDVLDDIPRYLNRFPIDIGKNSKAKYLEYHIANYLNEIYILYQRMGTYWKRVVRMYGNKKEDLALSNHIEEVLKFFEKIINTRGKHVHERRYNDDDLKRLVLFEMTSEMIRNNLEFEKYVVRDQANRIKRKWIRTIAKNKRELGIMLDAYFGFLKVIVFDKNNKIIFPDKLLKEKRT